MCGANTKSDKNKFSTNSPIAALPIDQQKAISTECDNNATMPTMQNQNQDRDYSGGETVSIMRKPRVGRDESVSSGIPVVHGRVLGSCSFKKCGSNCCRQFRLYYPKQAVFLPMQKKQRRFKYPKEQFEKMLALSGKDLLRLFSWRNIKFEAEHGELYIVFAKAQKWSIRNGRHHDMLVLPDVACKYLRSDGSCKIHQRKPAICKDFPRGPDEIPEVCTYKWVEDASV